MALSEARTNKAKVLAADLAIRLAPYNNGLLVKWKRKRLPKIKAQFTMSL
jgi:hypothetical protein